jgi:hypothetical protein
MNLDLLFENLTNPALFFLGIIATRLKSDLEITQNTSKFISLYLLLSIGFKGGQELAQSLYNGYYLVYTIWSYNCHTDSYLLLLYSKLKFSIENSGAIAGAYSCQCSNFCNCCNLLRNANYTFSGHMVAVMALMEAPAIIIESFWLRFIVKER